MNSLIRRRLFMGYSGDILPKEYQKVQYLESDGNQYINTGINGNNNSLIKISFSTTASSSPGCGLFGCQSSGSGITLNFGTQNYTRWGTFNWFAFFTVLDGNIHSISYSEYGFYDNETLIFTPTHNIFTTGNMWLGKINGAVTSGQKKIYSCTIYDGSSKISDFIPCYRKTDNVAGFYDIVNNIFHTNDGSGSFVIGPDA